MSEKSVLFDKSPAISVDSVRQEPRQIKEPPVEEEDSAAISRTLCFDDTMLSQSLSQDEQPANKATQKKVESVKKPESHYRSDAYTLSPITPANNSQIEDEKIEDKKHKLDSNKELEESCCSDIAAGQGFSSGNKENSRAMPILFSDSKEAMSFFSFNK